MTLDQIKQSASKLHTQRKLSDEFSARFQRLLKITRLILLPYKNQFEVAKARFHYRRFFKDITGEDLDPDDGAYPVVPVLVEELLRLHELVGGPDFRRKTEKKYFSAK